MTIYFNNPTSSLNVICGEMVDACISEKLGNPIVPGLQAEIGINIIPIQLPYVQEEGKTKRLLWWVDLIALLILVIIGGAYLRWKFWSGVFG
jgi:hypothetical protein